MCLLFSTQSHAISPTLAYNLAIAGAVTTYSLLLPGATGAYSSPYAAPVGSGYYGIDATQAATTNGLYKNFNIPIGDAQVTFLAGNAISAADFTASVIDYVDTSISSIGPALQTWLGTAGLAYHNNQLTKYQYSGTTCTYNNSVCATGASSADTLCQSVIGSSGAFAVNPASSWSGNPFQNSTGTNTGNGVSFPYIAYFQCAPGPGVFTGAYGNYSSPTCGAFGGYNCYFFVGGTSTLNSAGPVTQSEEHGRITGAPAPTDRGPIIQDIGKTHPASLPQSLPVPTLSGPTSITGPKTTTVDPATAKVTEITPTYSIAYSPATVTAPGGVITQTQSESVKITNPDGTSTTTTINGTPTVSAAQSQCELDPYSVGCAILGDVPVKDTITTIDATAAINPTSLGAGSCPAPITLSIHHVSNLSLSFQPLCDFAGMIRGVVIALAWLSAGLLVLSPIKT